MSIWTILIVFVVLAVVVWAIRRFIPMDATFSNALPPLALLLFVVWVFYSLFGGHLPSATIPAR